MTNHFKHVLSLSVIAFFIALAFASVTANNAAISKETGQIPPEFDNTTDTLLVLRDNLGGIGTGSVIKSAFKDYEGPYLIIETKKLSSYDKREYRYVLYFSHNASAFVDQNGRPGPGTVSVVMEDRQSDIKYRSTGVPNFGKLLKNYIAKLNALK
jgi:hypothetical protein